MRHVQAARRAILSRSAHIQDIPLRLDVSVAHRQGRLAALDFRLINHAPIGTDAFEVDDAFSRDGSYDMSGIVVLDRHAGNQLTTLPDPNTDTSMTQIGSGGSQNLRIAFPAPSGKAVDVLVPHFGLFRDVPVR